IVETIHAALSPRVVFFKNDIPARKLERLPLENEWSGGGEPAATITESGLRFVVEPAVGQKTGFFLDQRENRGIARSVANGKRVLNLFSYSGAFGVYAAAGGASAVTNVDVSEKAIALARTNYELNGFGAEFVAADAFDWIRKTGDRFDLVICDPPAFAKSRGDVDRAARGYKDINLQSLRHVAPGGMLMTFSCSGHMSLDLFQKVIFSAAADAGRRASIVRRLTAGPDHPVSLYCPEGEYLKGFLLAVE
ncbi:MAG TPA: class I SAM-dependent rRNA methyltransferase, partial [Thermoanaerobaculia bacterium]|nr:class I SAM-dependent rRNA methyltransferase [Thermoanaerobaculia bacterium]